MIITNKLNLPKAIVNSIDNDHEYKPHNYSVTELLKPTREIILSRRYDKQISRDVSDSIMTLLGSALHKIFESNSPDNVLTEHRMSINMGIDTITGVADYISDDDVIGDYKSISVSKVIKKDFADYEMQLKIYAYMFYRIYDKRIKECKLHCILKDWSKVKYVNSKDYPSSAYYEHSFKITDSDLIQAEKYITWKLKEIHDNEFNDDDKLIECSDTEKWYSGTKYAVYKKQGDKRAFKVCDSKEEAESIGGIVEERIGNCLKCELYCDCAKFCKK